MGRTGWRVMARTLGMAGAMLAGGCVIHAPVELAAADTMDAVADMTQRALDEFDRDLAMADRERRLAVVGALVARIRRDHADDALVSGHEAAFTSALDRLQEDRRTAWVRHARASDNVDLLRETASGLRRLALESMSMEDEARRYLTAVLEARRAAASGPGLSESRGAVRGGG